MGRIIVGVDGSENAKAALRWAVAAAHPDDKVVAVNIWDLPTITGTDNPHVDPFEGVAWDKLDRTFESLDPTLAARVTGEVHRGHPGRVLVDLSEDADLLVVGARGHGGFVALVLGSIASYAVHHAKCPVVVVPAPKADALQARLAEDDLGRHPG